MKRIVELIAIDKYNRQRAYLMLKQYNRKNPVTGKMETRYRILDIENADFGTLSHKLGFLTLPVNTSNGIIVSGLKWSIK